ncbi:interleukin 12a [Cricetulus griseus]
MHVSLRSSCRDRERKQETPSWESPTGSPDNYKNVSPRVSVATASPPASSCSAQCQTRMCPSRCLLFLTILVLLIHLSLARATPVSRPAQCLDRSQNLLRTTNHMLDKARQILKHYPCTAEDIDHEDITADKTSTLKACLPPELVKTLCLGSIYEDLKVYRTEFKAINAELLDHNQKQVILDENMLTAIDELMQALNLNGETLPQRPSQEEGDPYKVKMKLCILLQAFSIRAVTINRVMSYLNSS